MRSLQLLYTVSGNQARLDARTEFENLEPSLRGGVEAGRTHHCSTMLCESAAKIKLSEPRPYSIEFG